MGPWLDSVTGWLTANPHGWAWPFYRACVECLAIAGMIVPGTVLLFAVAVLAGSGACRWAKPCCWASSAACWATCCLTRWADFPPEHPPPALLRTTRNGWPGPKPTSSATASPACWSAVSSARCAHAADGRRDVRHAAAALHSVSLLAGAGWSVAYLLPGWATGAAIRLPLPEGFWPQAGIVAASIAVLLGLSIHANVAPTQSHLLIGT
jgi:undecaprenyl-diphosphatase